MTLALPYLDLAATVAVYDSSCRTKIAPDGLAHRIDFPNRGRECYHASGAGVYSYVCRPHCLLYSEVKTSGWRRLVSIRGRLLTLAVGGVIPLLVVGLTVLWVVWRGKQQQLNEALEQQAELAAVVFDRWLDAQRQPLVTKASFPAGRLNDPSALE